MNYVIHSQSKIKYDQNFSNSRCNKNRKKLIILKMSRTFILNNNAEILLTSRKKKLSHCQMTNPSLNFK